MRSGCGKAARLSRGTRSDADFSRNVRREGVMTCEHAREFLADFLAGALEPSASTSFQGHFNECPTCRREAESMQKTWNSMENVPSPEPSPELRVRFHQLLEAYQQGQR